MRLITIKYFNQLTALYIYIHTTHTHHIHTHTHVYNLLTPNFLKGSVHEWLLLWKRFHPWSTLQTLHAQKTTSTNQNQIQTEWDESQQFNTRLNSVFLNNSSSAHSTYSSISSSASKHWKPSHSAHITQQVSISCRFGREGVTGVCRLKWSWLLWWRLGWF